MSETLVVYLGEVSQDRENWIPMDWGLERKDVEKKVQRRMKRLLGNIRIRAAGDVWHGRVSKFVWQPGSTTEVCEK